MKKACWLQLFLLISIACFGQKNLSILYNYKFGADTTCAGVWHYNDSLNREYALVGTSFGLTIFDVTNPASSTRIFDVPDTPGLWREVRVWSHYAYVSNEGVSGHGGGGITIVDLSTLPDAPAYKKYTGDSAIAGMLSTGHTVQVVDGYLYVNGSNIGSQRGTVIFSLADPWNPHYITDWNITYVHDCFVRGDTMISSEIYGQGYVINSLSVTKDTITTLQAQATTCNFTHSSWMSCDDHYLFTTDEKPNCPLDAFDISNLNNIQLIDLYRTKLNPVGEVHNPRVICTNACGSGVTDFIVCSCYGDSAHTGGQVTLVDASHPEDMIETGNIILGPKGTGLVLCWDADPFPQSGNIVATEINNGFFVLKPVYTGACFLEGVVTDCKSGFPLNQVEVEILLPPADTIVLASYLGTFTGAYKTGIPDGGTYDVRFSPVLAADSLYAADTIKGVVLQNCQLTTLNAGLCTVGIDEKSLSELFQVYPAPASDKLNIHFSSIAKALSVTFSITNVLGQSALPPLQAREADTTMDISKLASGIYFIQIKTESGSVTKRFVKD